MYVEIIVSLCDIKEKIKYSPGIRSKTKGLKESLLQYLLYFTNCSFILKNFQTYNSFVQIFANYSCIDSQMSANGERSFTTVKININKRQRIENCC